MCTYINVYVQTLLNRKENIQYSTINLVIRAGEVMALWQESISVTLLDLNNPYHTLNLALISADLWLPLLIKEASLYSTERTDRQTATTGHMQTPADVGRPYQHTWYCKYQCGPDMYSSLSCMTGVSLVRVSPKSFSYRVIFGEFSHTSSSGSCQLKSDHIYYMSIIWGILCYKRWRNQCRIIFSMGVNR